MTTINAILQDGSNVDMPALRSYLASLEAALAQANLAIGSGTITALVGTRTYATQAALFADLVPADDVFALVYADADPLKNGLYQKDGATTAGDWEGPFDLFASAAQALVQDLVDDAEAAQAAAEAAATALGNSGPNIAFDSNHEIVGPITNFNGYTHWDTVTPAFSTSSANIPIKTPVAVLASDSQYRRNFDWSKLPLKEGDTVTVTCLCYFASSGGQFAFYTRDAGGTNTGGGASAVQGSGGLKVLNITFTVPAGTIARGFALVTGGGAFEVGGVYISPSSAKPIVAPVTPSLGDVGEWMRLNDTSFAQMPVKLSQSGYAIKSKNLFDNAASDIVLGQFVNNATGALNANASYIASGFIPVIGGEDYSSDDTLFGAWYDINQVYIAGFVAADGPTFEAPALARYARISTLATAWQTLQFEQASASSAYAGYSEVIDPSVVANGDAFNKRMMRRWRIFQRQRALGQSVQFDFGFIGDSYTHNTARYINALATALVAKYGDAGGGWVGFGSNAGSVNGNARPGIYTLSRVGLWGQADSSNYINSPSPDIARGNSSTPGDAFNLAGPASPALSGARFFWEGTADGVMRYRWNGGSWTTINVQGSGAQSAALSGIPTGAWTLDLEVVSGNCRPQGVNLTSAAAGIRIHKLAGTGTQAAQWAAVDATGWQTQIAALGLDAVQVMHGPNDQANDRTPAQFAANVQTIMARALAAVPGIDRLITMPPENQMEEPVKMVGYARATAKVAVQDRIAYLNTQPAFGDPNNPTEYGSAGALVLFASDNIHPVTEPDPNAVVLLNEILDFLGVA